MMREFISNSSFWKGFLLTIIYGGIGFLSLNFDITNYGWALFVILPLSMGLAGSFDKDPKVAIMGVFVGLSFIFIILIVTALEGVICLLLLSPIYISFIGIGYALGKRIKRTLNSRNTGEIKIQLIPLLLFLSATSIEEYVVEPDIEVHEVSSEIILPYSPNEVFDAIKSVDTLIAQKPLLMQLDLPVPHKCILEKEEVGALRICYFKEGTITERITELERGKVLRMDVIDYGLPGRPWLNFVEAIYYFESVGLNSCKMTRVSTYTTELNPRIYWERFERMAIEQEHVYVFRNLQRDLRNLHMTQ